VNSVKRRAQNVEEVRRQGKARTSSLKTRTGKRSETHRGTKEKRGANKKGHTRWEKEMYQTKVDLKSNGAFLVGGDGPTFANKRKGGKKVKKPT